MGRSILKYNLKHVQKALSSIFGMAVKLQDSDAGIAFIFFKSVSLMVNLEFV